MGYFKTEDLAVGYDGQVLIHDISIQIEKGTILTLIGPNGAGKSTILKSITRHLTKLGGMVYIGGREVYAWSAREMARQVAVVLTDRIRPELMTCGEVVAMGRYPYTNALGKLTETDKRIVRQALERVHASWRSGTSPPSATASASGSCWPGPSASSPRSSSWTSLPPIWISAIRSSCWIFSGKWPGSSVLRWSCPCMRSTWP